MDHLLGIDGGGSKTVALLANGSGSVLGRGTAGTSNYQVAGAGAARAALEEAIASAYAAAQLPPEPARVLVLGLAGVDRPGDRALFEKWAATRRLADRTIIVNDAEIGLAAGTPEYWGVGIICGTGSIAFGRSRDGRTARAGGWGHILGDEGSGYAMGLAALRAVMRAADGRAPATALASLVLGHWSLAQPSDLVRRVYVMDVQPAEIAALTALVERAAAAGDAVASGIVRNAGHELALAAAAVVHSLALLPPVPCAEIGGVIVHGVLVAQAFHDAAAHLHLELAPITPVVEPALGAVKLAVISSQ